VACCGNEQSAQHFHGCGFSGSVGSEKSKDLPALHLKADGIHGREITKALSEFVCGDDFVVHFFSSIFSPFCTSCVRAGFFHRDKAIPQLMEIASFRPQ
jgi:hypothetical protein